MMDKIWGKFAKDYEKKVISLTKVPRRRKQILKEIKRGKILNLGTGPTPYLNMALIKNNTVTATDFSKEMLDAAKNAFTHKNLEYKKADSRNLPFADESFDSIISINSIIPEKRKEADIIIKEAYRVLKPRGRFIAILPSYDNAKKAVKIHRIRLKLDEKQLRVWDSGQWQCFHTLETIGEMMGRSGFKKYKVRKLFLKTKEEIRQIRKIYGINASKHLVYEYFLVAEK